MFNRDLKVSIELNCAILEGRAFHNFGVALKNALSPKEFYMDILEELRRTPTLLQRRLYTLGANSSGKN